jgi:hypothetical protein
LNDAVLPDRFGQRMQFALIDSGAWLIGIWIDQLNGDFQRTGY